MDCPTCIELISTPAVMAVSYSEHGWAVFPLHTAVDGVCDCRKKCSSPGKHPRTMAGFKDASTDYEKVSEWWSIWPQANIGIATGAVSGIVVVDVDPRNGGLETASGIFLPKTAQVLTQGGGFHLYYKYPGPRKLKLGAGIDYKGDGGYVVAPPSVGPLGVYVWQVAMEPQAL